MKCTQIVIYRVSAKAGHIRTNWVQEVRSDGWVRATQDPEVHALNGSWIAPHNVITFTEPHFGYDYGGVAEGTLVQVFDEVGMVVRRRGAGYDVLLDGHVKDVCWDSIRPVEDPCNDAG